MCLECGGLVAALRAGGRCDLISDSVARLAAARRGRGGRVGGTEGVWKARRGRGGVEGVWGGGRGNRERAWAWRSRDRALRGLVLTRMGLRGMFL